MVKPGPHHHREPDDGYLESGQVRRLVHVQISSSDEIRKSQKSSLSFDLFDMDATQFSISRLFDQDILLFLHFADFTLIG